jgi:hypothetical protein
MRPVETGVSGVGDRSYRLEPLDTSGIFLGLSVVQCVLVGAGITAAAVGITAGVPVPVAALPVVAAATACFARAGGHVLWEWLPLAVSWMWDRWRRGVEWYATPAEHPDGLDDGAVDEGAGWPVCLDGLELAELAWRDGRCLGAVRDRRRGTLTAVVGVSGPQFVVESRSVQERLLAGWGDVLGQFAVERGVVAHLGWSDLARPSGLGQHLDWLRHPRGTQHPEAFESYRELIGVATAAAITHDVTVTVTVAADRLHHRRRRRGEVSVDEQLGRALVSSTEALLRGLRSAGLAPTDPYDRAAIGSMLRARIDPTTTTTAEAGDTAVAGCRACGVGPVHVRLGWDHLRVDGVWQRCWWVASWPRLALGPAWLEPFLAAGAVTRTMTVTAEPVPTYRSRRRIERDLVKLESDATAKAERGRRVDARHRRATQALLSREEELVAGYPEIAYVGIVTVSAPSREILDEHSEIVEQLARETGMDLRLLEGRQDLAWAASLPAGIAPMPGWVS